MSSTSLALPFGPKANHRYFVRDGVVYSSPTHAVLPRLPPRRMQELEPEDARYWVIYQPHVYSPAVEQLPFILTHFSPNDPLLGTLNWNPTGSLARFPIKEIIGENAEEGFQLTEDKCRAWSLLEEVLKGASDIIWKDGSIKNANGFLTPLGFRGHLRQASSSKFWKIHSSHPAAVASITAARDSLLLSAALLSYTIARYQAAFPGTPDGWYSLLTQRQCHPTTADRIRASVVSRFDSSIRRVGVFIAGGNMSTGTFAHSCRLFASARVPIWFVWNAGEALRVPKAIRAYLPSQNEKIIPSPWTLDMDVIGKENQALYHCYSARPFSLLSNKVPWFLVDHPWAPHSFVPPATLKEAAVDQEIDPETFFAERSRYYQELWPTLSRNAQCQILTRLSDVKAILHPSDMSASVWIWLNEHNPTTRRQVIDEHEISSLWMSPTYNNRKFYDPYRNQFDLCTSLGPVTYASIVYDIPEEEENMGEGVIIESESDSARNGLGDDVTIDMNTIVLSYQFLPEDLMLPSYYLTPPVSEVCTAIYGLDIHGTPFGQNPNSKVIGEEWDLVCWLWGFPDLQIEDLGIDVSANFAALTNTLRAGIVELPDGVTVALSPSSDIPFDVKIHPLKNLQRGQPDSWYIITSKSQGVHPVLVVFDAITAHYCLTLTTVPNTTALKDHLLLRGVRFSIRVYAHNVFENNQAGDDAQHCLAKTKRSYIQKRLSDYEAIVSSYLGWRSPEATYSARDANEWLNRIQQWCTEYPARAQLALREGGWIWRLLICFVDIRKGASLPSDYLAMSRENSIEVNGGRILVDDELLPAEIKFLSGVYESYKDGKPDPSKSAKMKSWMVRMRQWDSCEINKKIWTPECEAHWMLIISDIFITGEPRLATFWKDWTRGHTILGESTPKLSWDRKRQAGCRMFRQYIDKKVEAYWKKKIVAML